MGRSSLCSMRSPSPSPVGCETLAQSDVSASRHLGVATDYRFAEHGRYDSATSMSALAANTDADDEGDDEAEAENVCERGEVSTMRQRQSAFKIVVSSPTEHHFAGRSEEAQNRNAFNSRMTAKRNKRRLCKDRERYLVSDYDDSDCGGSSVECSSEEDSECVTDDEDTLSQNELENGNENGRLFLSGNDLNVGVYSSFCFDNEVSGQSDSDYLSAQSDDFDELTICYHNEKNIGFRGGMGLGAGLSRSYLSDLGPSDIGSSDTECFSSADSVAEQ